MAIIIGVICLSLLTGKTAAAGPECRVTADGSRSCRGNGNVSLLQVNWRTELVNEVNVTTQHMLSTDASAASAMQTQASEVCECTKPSFLQVSSHSCSDCYEPKGETSCVFMQDPGKTCEGCKQEGDAWHCPDGNCIGRACGGSLQGFKSDQPAGFEHDQSQHESKGNQKFYKGSTHCRKLTPSEVPQTKGKPFEGWYDVEGSGRCKDYCRWQGCGGHGPDPSKNVVYVGKSGCLAFWSCKLSGSNEETGCGYFKSTSLPIFNAPMCSSKGGPTPPAVEFRKYVPGTQGAPWTKEEILIVRAKIRMLFARGHELMLEAGIDGSKTQEEWYSWPSAAKVLRLGFHDCFKYTDGTGGCDGCLNWDGVGVRFPRDTLGRGKYTRGGDGHNNGMAFTVEVLERIYTDRSFPSATPPLPVSLKESGKSRADLWAFAVMDSVEYSIDKNNHVCKDPEVFAPNQCHPRAGKPDCMVQMKRAFRFRTGRRDCSSDFKTYKHEIAPDATASGASTVKFFQEQFNFKNGEDVVAILGAHTLGRPHVIHSMFRYAWKAYSEQLFNNGYFRNMAKKNDWFYTTVKKNTCADRVVANATGQRPIARWVTHARGDTKTGGPVQWIQQKLVCPDLSPTGKCRPERQEWKFVMGLDETMIPCEIGLYYDFQVDDKTGIPSGCPGLKDFTFEKWGGWTNNNKGPGLKNYHMTWSRMHGHEAEPQCPPNKLKVGTSKPLHEVVEEFANDQPYFIKTFMGALELMLTNGYGKSETDNELVLAPDDGMKDFSCSQKGNVYSCESK